MHFFDSIVLLGPTASGKTRLAARLACALGGEILSADSRQVYRGLDIGTGKDRRDYVVGETTVPCHLIDLVDPEDEFSLYAFVQAFRDALADVRRRGRLPIAVGGTGLYLDAVLRSYSLAPVPEDPALRRELAGLDDAALAGRLRAVRPVLHNTTDLLDRARLVRAIEIAEHGPSGDPGRPPAKTEWTPLVVGVHWDRDALRRRIADRLHARMAEGLVSEVARLREQGLPWERLESLGLEYRYVGRFLQGRMSRAEMERVLEIRIRQFAKRQMTWFRGMERKGIQIHWIPGEEDALMRLVRAHRLLR